MNKLDIINMGNYSDPLKELLKEFITKKEMYINDNGTNKDIFWMRDLDSVGLICQIIRELESYIGPFGDTIANFESLYGTSAHAYTLKKKEEYKKAHDNKERSDNLGIERDIQKRFWEAKAKQSEYFARYGVISFIEDIERIIEEIINNKDKYSFEISNALRNLTSKNSGVDRVDNDNIRLLGLYEEKIEKDRELLKNKKIKEFESTIDSLRKTSLYTKKNHVGDKVHIGNKDSLTFKELFDELRYLYSKINYIIKTVDAPSISLNDGYNGYISRIDEISNKVNDLEYNHNKSLNEKNNYVFTYEEEDELRRLGEDISDKLFKIGKISKQLKEKKEKLSKLLTYIDAINQRLEAINETINVLESNKSDDNTPIFPNTLAMLFDERDKCIAVIYKNKDTIKLLDSLFNEVSEMINEVDHLNNSYDVILNRAKERKTIEDEKKKEEKVVNEQRLEALRKENRNEIIEKIKKEVIEQMTREGIRPRPYNYDGETYQEDYTEFNKIFRERLIDALNEKAVLYKESDLGNPYDTSITKTKPKLEKEEMGRYRITEESYLILYDLFKEELDIKGDEYDYDDVLDKIKKYLDSYFGLDNISNKDELKEIIKNHRKSTEDSRSR